MRTGAVNILYRVKAEMQSPHDFLPEKQTGR